MKAAILHGPGRVTPLLLSKEFEIVAAVLDLERDCCEFRANGERVDLVETKQGHYYGVPMFEGIQHGKKLHSEECFAVVREGRNRAYNITQLENSRRLHFRVKNPPLRESQLCRIMAKMGHRRRPRRWARCWPSS